MKTCRDCGETKPLTEYHKAATNKCGRRVNCKQCRAKSAAEDYVTNWFYRTCRLKKAWSKKHAVPFDLDAEYLESIYTTSCPVFNKPFVKGDKSNDMSPALDRVVPSLGYTKGNVRYVSARSNRIKYDATIEELELILKYMKDSLAC